MGALECSLQLTILVHGAQLALSRQRNLQTENSQIIGCGRSNPAIFADRPRPGSPASESRREKKSKNLCRIRSPLTPRLLTCWNVTKHWNSLTFERNKAMSHNRKLNRKNRTFRIELLDRREVMSATGWSDHHSDHSAADDTSLTAYIASGEDKRLSLTTTDRMLTASATPASTALPRIQQDVPYSVTKIGGTLQITANKAGYLIKVGNHFTNPQTGRVTLTIAHLRLPGVGGGANTIDVTGISRIAFTGTNGVDQFENNTGLTSTQRGNGGNDTLLGGWGTDYLYGGSGNDHLDGRNGHDELYGGKNGPIPIGSGAGGLGDRLFGGNGNDTLDGGEGGDHLDGGGDIDTAVKPQPGERLAGIERVRTTRLSAAAISQTFDSVISTGLNSQGISTLAARDRPR
jgi:hypothetical protein